MKPFNLEEAINGKAFYLENGYRGVIKYCVDDFITQFEQPPNYPYVGYVLDNKGFLFTAHTAWNENGKSNEYPSFNATAMVDDTPQQDNKKETMKKFDLKAALNGEPVMLRNGDKAYIFKDLRTISELKEKIRYPLVGININRCIVYAWSLDGQVPLSSNTAHNDIVGIFEEPKKQINIEDLPKPFKPKKDEEYFYLGCKTVYSARYCDDFDHDLSEGGQCFRTEEDAQKWLDFMKGMME